jgi:transcriptional regulator of acetoin/glycerol metabolism
VDLTRVERSAFELLTAASWPGNVRQLKQVLERLALRLNGSMITCAAVRAELDYPTDSARHRERMELLATLDAHEWNVRAAARTLGIARGTLYRRIREVGLERPPKGVSSVH